MRSSSLALLFVMACGSTAAPPATTGNPPAAAPDDPGSPPAATPGSPEDVTPQMAARSSPAAVTTAYLDAAIANKADDMLALMTPECRERAKAETDGFTKNLIDKKLKLRAYELGEPEMTADSATVAVQATFETDGKGDPEDMRFELKQQEPEGWMIAAIR